MSARNPDAHGSTALHRGTAGAQNEPRWGASIATVRRADVGADTLCVAMFVGMAARTQGPSPGCVGFCRSTAPKRGDEASLVELVVLERT